jgi:DNA end-binding protein Ku
VPIAAKAAPKTGGNVINLMDALKRSLTNEKQAVVPAAAKAKGKKAKKRVEGQREMLLPISGKRTAKEEPKKADKPVRTPARAKKAS